MSEAPFDLPRAQRWFGIEFNNLAWDLLEKPDRAAEETDRMIHAAHASVHHWLAAGNAVNHLRGMILLANVYAGAQNAENALRYARRALELSEDAGQTQSAFDRATAFACAARAHLVAGDRDESRRLAHLARHAAESLEADDRAVFAQLCPDL